MRTINRRYFAWFGAGFVASLLALAALVATVDPYGLTGLVKLPGINAEKTRRLAGGGRVEHSIRLWLGHYPTVILGSSRCQVGIDPASPALGPEGAYNACLAGTNMAELYAAGRFILQHQHPRRVILTLSFDLFSAARAGSADFALSGFDGGWMPLVWARTFISFSSLVDALRTIEDNMAGEKSPYRDRSYVDNAILLGRDFDYRQAFEDVLKKKFLVDPDNFATYTLDSRRLELLHDLLARFAAAGTEVYVAVSPLHARLLEAAWALGLYPDYERWLRGVTQITDEVNRAGSPGRITLWDFSGYNAITTESVPAFGARRRMRWYWESSHYSAATGELMLERMLGQAGGPPPPAGFGVRLDSSNIDALLTARRDRRLAYATAQPAEIADVRQLVAETKPIRARVRARSRQASVASAAPNEPLAFVAPAQGSNAAMLDKVQEER